jgi:hypothetical protein
MAKVHDTQTVHTCQCETCREHLDTQVAEEHRLINRLVATTDERNRRRLVGFLARQHGHGGIALMARITGLSPPTIRRGWRELSRPDTVGPGRVRQPGAGRKRAEVKHPGY